MEDKCERMWLLPYQFICFHELWYQFQLCDHQGYHTEGVEEVTSICDISVW